MYLSASVVAVSTWGAITSARPFNGNNDADVCAVCNRAYDATTFDRPHFSLGTLKHSDHFQPSTGRHQQYAVFDDRHNSVATQHYTAEQTNTQHCCGPSPVITCINNSAAAL